MIQNCAVTLEDLDNVTKKYRDGVMISSNEGDSGPSRGQKRRTRLRNAIASNWAKITWDMDKDSLKTYRDRLQSHVDAINLVLSTFHWSATEKIYAHNKIQAEKMQEFHDNMVQSNCSLAQLVEAMHSMLLRPKQATPGAFLMGMDYELEGSSGGAAESASVRAGGFAPREIVPVAAHHVPIGMFNKRVPGLNMANFAMLSVPSGQAPAPIIKAFSAMSAVEAVAPSPSIKPPQELPPKIVSINIRRQSQGARALADLKQSLTPKLRPSFLDPTVPSVGQLSEGLEYIFSPLPRSTGRQLEIAREARVGELRLWTQSLDHLINSLAIPHATSGDGSHKLTVSQHRNDLISILSKINEAIETSSANMRDLVYEGFSAAHIDHTLDKVLSLTNLVRAHMQVEEFMEERSDWLRTR
ncbi:hypothetical protein CLAIMM_03445 [Cladophialophora immunda]|nr:hypothetical protein CLAIMM_03445 [Cladophialophora immunda]